MNLSELKDHVTAIHLNHEQRIQGLRERCILLEKRVEALEEPPPPPIPQFNVRDYSGWPAHLREVPGISSEDRARLADILERAFTYIEYLEEKLEGDDDNSF